MRVRVRADGHNIFIPIPSCLLFNSLSAYLVYRFATPHVDALSGLSYAQMRALMYSVNRARHNCAVCRWWMWRAATVKKCRYIYNNFDKY